MWTRIAVPSPSGSRSLLGFPDPEEESTTFLKLLVNYTSNDTTWYPRRLKFATAPLREPQILQHLFVITIELEAKEKVHTAAMLYMYMHYINTFIPLIHKCVIKTVGCGTSHKHTNIQMYSAQYYKYFTYLHIQKNLSYNPPSSSVGLHVFLPGNLSVRWWNSNFINNWTLLILFILFHDCGNLQMHWMYGCVFEKCMRY